MCCRRGSFPQSWPRSSNSNPSSERGHWSLWMRIASGCASYPSTKRTDKGVFGNRRAAQCRIHGASQTCAVSRALKPRRSSSGGGKIAQRFGCPLRWPQKTKTTPRALGEAVEDPPTTIVPELLLIATAPPKPPAGVTATPLTSCPEKAASFLDSVCGPAIRCWAC